MRAGQTALCFKLNTESSRAVEIAAMSGFDCVWLDMEHTACDWAVIERQILAAKIHDVDVMVRVARGGYSDYIRPLELDASGIMVPHIMGKADAEAVARMTRFHPEGRRPVDGGNADGAYCAIDFKDYIRQANRERFVFIQVEDPEPLAELDAIAEVKGIDLVFFGPGDFSHGIGFPGEQDHPLVVETREKVAAAAGRAGKFAGTVCPPGRVREYVNMGFRFLSIGADVTALRKFCQDSMRAARESRAVTQAG